MKTNEDSYLNLFDPLAPHPNLYQEYDCLPSVYWSTATGAWVVTTYKEVGIVMSDKRFTKRALLKMQQQKFGEEVAPMFARFLFLMDPPEHTQLRGHMAATFLDKIIQLLRPQIQTFVDRLLEPTSPLATMEVVRDLADPLPFKVISTILGVPPNDYNQFKGRFHILIKSVAPLAQREDVLASAQIYSEFHTYFKTLVLARRAAPSTGLMDTLIEQIQDDDLLADTCIQVIFAGTESTSYLIGNGLFLLLSEHSRWEDLKGNPSLLEPAIEEMVRMEAPIQFFQREASEDVVLGDQTIPAGSSVVALVGAANRDPTVYSHPHLFDMRRFADKKQPPHLSFGRGFRYCLGAQVARLEMQIVLQTLLERYPATSLVNPIPQWRPGGLARSLEQLLITLS